MVDFTEENFISWVAYMFVENCKERSDWGDKPYPSAKAYLKKNKAYLKEEYKKIRV
jgi:hypothetical protein|tara:strand:+ start:22 stop:189 length:168 start_codon:yes stop_codon:yes gene_type:complete